MRERQLQNLFAQFLLSKGYSQDNLLIEVALRPSGEGVFRPDLLIIDTNNNEYIALVEFKNKINGREEVNALGQVYKYFSLLGTKGLPAYLVFPISEDDFQILYLNSENKFEPISKEDFPSYEALSSRKIAEEKIKHREVEEKTLYELEQKKKRSKQSAYFAVISLMVGIMASIISIFLQQKKQNAQPSSISFICCDSVKAKNVKLEKRLENLEARVALVVDGSKVDRDYVSKNYNIIQMDKRIRVIENGISDNPEKVLALLQIKQEIDMLKRADDYSKEITQTKIDAIRNEIAVQNGWLLGVVIAIFGGILALVIPNLISRWSGGR